MTGLKLLLGLPFTPPPVPLLLPHLGSEFPAPA